MSKTTSVFVVGYNDDLSMLYISIVIFLSKTGRCTS
nr:MAG TPA: hypothetical protein [Caudoviricetes sp.]